MILFLEYFLELLLSKDKIVFIDESEIEENECSNYVEKIYQHMLNII